MPDSRHVALGGRRGLMAGKAFSARQLRPSPAAMKHPAWSGAVLAISTLLFSPAAQADDLKALQGTWKLESVEARGQKEESDDAKDIVLKITGERYEIRIKDKIDGGTLKLDETKKPKTLDATDTEGDDVGKVVKAIYELSGDTLRVCHAGDDDERPKEMATKEDSPVIMMTFKREKKTE
jgi:uncharacterized protein (TIGR03067 family)